MRYLVVRVLLPFSIISNSCYLGPSRNIFHLILIEHCRGVIEDALQRGEPIAFSNCDGVSNALLDRRTAGFFTSEPILETVGLSTPKSLTSPGTHAARTLASSDQTHLVSDAAHPARLTCLAALETRRFGNHIEKFTSASHRAR